MSGPKTSFFRRPCLACDEETPASKLCVACSTSIYPITSACPTCATPFDEIQKTPCRACLLNNSAIDAATSGYHYGAAIAKLMLRFKTEGRADMVYILSSLGYASFSKAALGCEVALPIPLHWQRLGKRGYNQSDLLLQKCAKATPGLQPLNSTLKRRRATEIQGHLSKKERKHNLEGAFAINARNVKHIRGKRVLLVDDVMTTGATLNEAARVLKHSGAHSVYTWTLCRKEKVVSD